MNNMLPEKFKGGLQEAAIIAVREHAGQQTIEIHKEYLLEACRSFKDKLGFSYLVDIVGIDHYTDERRFEVLYILANMASGERIRLSVRLDEHHPEMPSLVHLWPGAAWNEREAFDMLGIRFDGNPDLRRIFMPEDFEYFPLRKEFPLLGIPGAIQLPDKDIPGKPA